jgi:NADH-quinone oxidoreductase subunit C
MMQTLEQIKATLDQRIPGVCVEIIPNGAPTLSGSLLIDNAHALAAANLLKDDPDLRFDFASNVTGIDWPERIIKEKVKVKKLVDGAEKEVEEVVERKTRAYLECVYHLYSISRREGPLVIRLRTGDRSQNVALPSLTPVWRSCEFQEREVYDLFGIQFQGHPDLRRILMWEEFVDHPMRKDYVAPDDCEYEPTPHDDLIAKAQRHYPVEAAS